MRDMPLSTCSVAAEPAAGALRGLAPGRDLLQAVEHRGDAGRDALVLGARRDAVQHLDRRPRAERRAQRDALVEMRDEEDVAAFGRQRARDLAPRRGHSRRP